MAEILAIEADRSRRTLLKALIREHVHVDVAMVDSVKAAIASFSQHQPDLIIAPTLLSPADSEQLAAHVKLHLGPHVQMVTISALDVLRESAPEENRRTGFFRRRPISLGLQYDPHMVGKQIADRLERARGLRDEYASGFRAPGLVDAHHALIVRPSHNTVHPMQVAQAAPAPTIVLPNDKDRRCAARTPQQSPSLWAVRMPWGTDVNLINISRTGVLIESGSKVTPGVTLELQLSGLGLQRMIMARFIRSEIAHVGRLGVRYHAAAQFEQPLDILPVHGKPAAPSTSESLSKLLTAVLSDRDQPEAASIRFARGLRGLLRARDVLIRRAPIASAHDNESIYFTVSEDGDSRTILQIMFERDRNVTAAEFRLSKAAAAVTAAILEIEELSIESAQLAVSRMSEVA
jgi:CheY-like chemotaxis protein